MALHVVIEKNRHAHCNSTNERLTWHRGEPNPLSKVKFDAEFDQVRRIRVDGEELSHVLRVFSTLPQRKFAYTVRYSGDMAQFIMENLTLDQ